MNAFRKISGNHLAKKLARHKSARAVLSFFFVLSLGHLSACGPARETPKVPSLVDAQEKGPTMTRIERGVTEVWSRPLTSRQASEWKEVKPLIRESLPSRNESERTNLRVDPPSLYYSLREVRNGERESVALFSAGGGLIAPYTCRPGDQERIRSWFRSVVRETRN